MKHRKLEQVRQDYHQYVMGNYAPSDLLFVRGEGVSLWDSEDRRYLDFSSGIAVCNLGHCHPAVTKAICDQAGRLVHVSNLFLNERQPELAKLLIEHTMDGVCFFCNSGAEANEALIKLARKNGAEKGKSDIIAMNDSFHGRTLATLAATGRSKYRNGFAPDMPGFKFVDFNDFSALENAVDAKTAAVLLEPVQGEGGIIPADAEYLKKVRALCTRKKIMLLFDEVQCGMGRSGSLFAWQDYGVMPDAFSLAKGIANGFPMGAIVCARKFAGVLTPGTHGSTFGGTALASAAAIAVVRTITGKKVLENVRKQSMYLTSKLNAFAGKYPFVKGVRGRGLMLGLVLDMPAAPILAILRKKGLIALSAGETVLRLLPPLIVTKADCDKALRLIDTALSEYAETLKKS